MELMRLSMTIVVKRQVKRNTENNVHIMIITFPLLWETMKPLDPLSRSFKNHASIRLL